MKSPSVSADKWYVYAYRDPKDSKPFYIGKGTDLRMFSHAKGYGSKETNRDLTVGEGFSSVEFSSVLQKLKDGEAVREEPTNCFTPKYESVEV